MARLGSALTLKQRLIALIVASTVIIVASLTIYFTSRQIDEIGDDLRGKASAYADVVGKQAMSAVAFSDRETAREVLESIKSDRDLDSVTLVGAHGTRLYVYGSPSAWVDAATLAPGEIVTDSRISRVVPVLSLEGPRGTLVLELSTRRIATARAHLLWLAVVCGGVALVLATVMAWLIARGVARRLQNISIVATAVANGDLTQQPVEDGRADEIGLLAFAFNAMLAQIKQLISRIRELARQEQVRLESLVAERTAALDLRTSEMRLVFDQVDQGLLVVDLDGTIAREHSGAVERWLGRIPDSYALADLVAAFAPGQADWYMLMWSSLVEDILPVEVCLAQLPDRFLVGGRSLLWSYKVFVAPTGQRRILIKITDETSEVERRRSEVDERETTSLFTRMVRDRAGYAVCHAEIARLVDEIAGAQHDDDAAYRRSVHTLKGVSGMLELVSISDACHALETAHDDGDLRAERAQVAVIELRWRFLAGKLGGFLDDGAGRVHVHDHDLSHLQAAIVDGAPATELARIVETWRQERAATSLERIAEQARALAARSGKAALAVVVDADPSLRLPATLGAFVSALVHAVRNAIDHGIEPSGERLAAGKPAAGTLTLRAHSTPAAISIEVADDGRGIQWDKIAAAARARGLPADTREDLDAALFSDGLSSRSEVDELSGRGIGMAALRAACTESGGQITTRASEGGGTTLRFSWTQTMWHGAPRLVARPTLTIRETAEPIVA